MKYTKAITILVLMIALAATVASVTGIVSDSGDGSYEYETIRGPVIEIYGKGLYRHMSSELAIQGIAQDYITLLAGVPLLILGLVLFLRKSRRGRLLLAGVLLYFFLTYLFYTAMAMYNYMFPAYIILLGTSLFSLILVLSGFIFEDSGVFFPGKLMKSAGVFLIINSSLVALLWLGEIVPPLINGTLYPSGLHHYTTLIVQGFDLGIFLPLGIVSGIMATRGIPSGHVFASVYTIFLSLLMAALNSKILFMAKEGANVIPVVFIMPVVFVVSLVFAFLIMKNLKTAED